MPETLIRLSLAEKILGRSRQVIKGKLKSKNFMVMKLGNITYTYKEHLICVSRRFFNLTDEQEQEILERF